MECGRKISGLNIVLQKNPFYIFRILHVLFTVWTNVLLFQFTREGWKTAFINKRKAFEFNRHRRLLTFSNFWEALKTFCLNLAGRLASAFENVLFVDTTLRETNIMLAKRLDQSS